MSYVCTLMGSSRLKTELLAFISSRRFINAKLAVIILDVFHTIGPGTALPTSYSPRYRIITHGRVLRSGLLEVVPRVIFSIITRETFIVINIHAMGVRSLHPIRIRIRMMGIGWMLG